MEKLKKYALMIIIVQFFMLPRISVEAADIDCIKTKHNQSQIIPFADRIVCKYRIFQGRHQFRRWNETRRNWVDRAWIDM